jgi:hypothetical protein
VTLAEIRRRMAGLDAARRGTDARAVRELLAALGGAAIDYGDLLARFHDALLFLCAYPQSPVILKRAESLLKHFSRRVARLEDETALLDPAVSGIAGTAVDLIFTYDFVRWLIGRVPGALAIDWDDDGPDRERLASVLLPLLPLFEEEASVDANVPAEEWLCAAGAMSDGQFDRQKAEGRGQKSIRAGQRAGVASQDTPPLPSAFCPLPSGDKGLAWLLGALEHYPSDLRATLYDSLRIWVIWALGESKLTRTLMRRPPKTIFYQRTPLLARREVSLDAALAGPPLPVIRLARAEGAEVLDMARAALGVRYRELYAFTYGDPDTVIVADGGRGLEIVLAGITPDRRLPLRAGFGPLLLRNGVPIGYADAYALCDRIEVSFNIFYAFRDGESAYCFAQLLKLYRQLFRSTVFSIDPYQIGEGNEEAIEAGAFWFYRKLGFRSTDPEVERLAHREESRMAADPRHRTAARTLRRMAHSPLLYEVAAVRAASTPSPWEHFRIRNIGLAIGRAFAASGQPAAMYGAACAIRVADALSLNVAKLTPRQRHAFERLAPMLALVPDLERWSEEEREAVAAIVKAKVARREERYIRLTTAHTRLRGALIGLGS